MDKTLKVKSTTYAKLTKMAAYGDTMDDVINRLFESAKIKKKEATTS